MSLRPVQTEILRAVVSPKVCSGAAKVLRAGAGGDEATYNLSQPCENIDVFLSHSWRDSGLLKYLAICLHFNGMMALLCSSAASVIVCVLQRVYGLPGLPLLPIVPFMNVFNDFFQMARDAGFDHKLDPKVYPCSDSTHHPLYSPTCQVVGTSVFLLVFLFGHRLRAPVSMFLDKVRSQTF